MKLEVGKKYLTHSGHIVEIQKQSPGGTKKFSGRAEGAHPAYSNYIDWNEKGEFAPGEFDRLNIESEYTPPV
jgi:hypothetical protein